MIGQVGQKRMILHNSELRLLESWLISRRTFPHYHHNHYCQSNYLPWRRQIIYFRNLSNLIQLMLLLLQLLPTGHWLCGHSALSCSTHYILIQLHYLCFTIWPSLYFPPSDESINTFRHKIRTILSQVSHPAAQVPPEAESDITLAMLFCAHILALQSSDVPLQLIS